MPATDDSFFSRWSRRKVAVRQGEVPPPEPAPEPASAPPLAQPAAPAALAPSPRPQAAAAAPAAEPPAPTLADVQQLTPDSDFTAFVRPQVQPEVRNAALKKLFADPHFNVMDGLDTYIEDYNTPDPLPPGMLRQLVQSEALGLFAPAPAPQPVAETPPVLPAPPGASTTAPTAPAEAAAAAPPTEATPPVDRHEDADLQLQPDDAAGRPGADPGAAAHAGGPH